MNIVTLVDCYHTRYFPPLHDHYPFSIFFSTLYNHKNTTDVESGHRAQSQHWIRLVDQISCTVVPFWKAACSSACNVVLGCHTGLQRKKKNNPPCFHSSRVYIKALMIPTSRLFLTPGLLPTPVSPSPPSPHGNNLPFSSAAVVKHLAVNCHCHTIQALTIYASWRRKAEMVNCI